MFSSQLANRIQSQLAKRRDDDLYRHRVELQSAQDAKIDINGRQLLNFCSNDYLGLANHPAIVDACNHATAAFGYGAGASHLVNGHSQLHHQLEQELAAWLGYERVLLFSTGFAANTALLQTLVMKSDIVFQDKLNHASLIDGGQHCAGVMKRYKHLGMQHLEQLLHQSLSNQDCSGERFIATDGVFSMDGDQADINQIAELAQRFQSTLIIDEAHSLGVIGQQGRGLIDQLDEKNTQLNKPIIMGTLGKAFGCAGAFVAADNDTIEYLIQFARPYIYSTAMPPSQAAAALQALTIIQTEPERREKLHQTIAYFKRTAKQAGLELSGSQTPIQPVIIGDSAKTLAISEALRKSGIMVSAIRPPTVPKNTARLRITLTAHHSEAQINQLVDSLASTFKDQQINKTETRDHI